MTSQTDHNRAGRTADHSPGKSADHSQWDDHPNDLINALDGGLCSVSDLLDVMAALRTPGSGCPWDLEQDFKSIAPYTIEEAYEVADAIARGDLGDLKEELGDLLLQVVYHARMAEETGAFAFNDVVDAITRKMIRRHPHVFGTSQERAAGVQPGFWERLKDIERAERAKERASSAGRMRLDDIDDDGGRSNPPQPHATAPELIQASTPGADLAGTASASVLDDVPLPLPALTRAVKLQNKAARVGFDWPSLDPVLEKMREELRELEVEITTGADKKRVEEEYGDLLFVIANVARHLEIDPEAALRAANDKFTRRFQRIEELLASRGKTPAQSNLEEMEAFWEQAKSDERVNEPKR